MRRESENLKDAVKRAIWKAVSGANRDDAIHPIVFRELVSNIGFIRK